MVHLVSTNERHMEVTDASDLLDMGVQVDLGFRGEEKVTAAEPVPEPSGVMEQATTSLQSPNEELEPKPSVGREKVTSPHRLPNREQEPEPSEVTEQSITSHKSPIGKPEPKPSGVTEQVTTLHQSVSGEPEPLASEEKEQAPAMTKTNLRTQRRRLRRKRNRAFVRGDMVVVDEIFEDEDSPPEEPDLQKVSRRLMAFTVLFGTN